MSRYLIIAVVVFMVLVESAYALRKTESKTDGTALYHSSRSQHPLNGKLLYDHPQLHYAFEYPASWRLIQSENDNGSTASFLKVVIENGDYKVSPLYSDIESGCRITVYAEKTNKGDVMRFIAGNPEWRRLAKNTTEAFIAGTKAAQFDNGYEAGRVHTTVFIKNNTAYTVQFEYADSQTRSDNWSIYAELLSSFSTE